MSPVNVPNPFRNPTHRAVFEECVRSWRAQAGGIRRADGSRVMGNSIATAFWRGYDGIRGPGRGYITRTDKQSLGYVYWRAGQAVRRAEESCARSA